MGEKKPVKRRRSNPCADATSRIVVERLALLGAFDDNGHVAQPVLDDWYKTNCTRTRARRNPTTGRTETYIEKRPVHTFDAMEKGGSAAVVSSQSYYAPKRWYDVKLQTRLFMMLASLKCSNTPHRKLSFYIGQELIEWCISGGIPLAGFVNKRINRLLKQILGEVDFGIWFQIEPSPNPPFALHAHGLIFVDCESWFKKHSSKRRKIVRALKIASGEDGSMYAANWLDMSEGEVDAFWITYCTKGTWGKRFNNRYPSVSVEVSSPPYAISHSLRRRGKRFYDRLRPLMRAVLSNRFDEFDESDWNLLNQHHPDTGMRSLPFSISWRHKPI